MKKLTNFFIGFVSGILFFVIILIIVSSCLLSGINHKLKYIADKLNIEQIQKTADNTAYIDCLEIEVEAMRSDVRVCKEMTRNTQNLIRNYNPKEYNRLCRYLNFDPIDLMGIGGK